MKTLLILILSSFVLHGCAAWPVLLVNEKGETVKCEAGAGKEDVDSCVKKYEAAGYKRVQQPEPEYRRPMGY